MQLQVETTIYKNGAIGEDIKAAQTTAEGAVAEEQRIYYRAKNNDAGVPSAPSDQKWIAQIGNVYNENTAVGDNGWTTKITPIAKSDELYIPTSDTSVQQDKTYYILVNGKYRIVNNQSIIDIGACFEAVESEAVEKYPYLYTCVQTKTVKGDISNSVVLIDDSDTIIDGGKIITGSIDANKINVRDLSAFKADIGGVSIDTDRLYSNKDQYSYYEFLSNGKFNIIDGEESDQERAYIKFNQINTDNSAALEVKLKELIVNIGSLYGVDNDINVIDLIAQQDNFIDLWNGTTTYFTEIPSQEIDEETSQPVINIYEVYEKNHSYYYTTDNEESWNTIDSYKKAVDYIDFDINYNDYYVKNEDDIYELVQNPNEDDFSNYYIKNLLIDSDNRKIKTVEVAGLGRALSFIEDSNNNFQALKVSSGIENNEKVGIIVDPNFIQMYSIDSNQNQSVSLKVDENNISFITGDEDQLYFSSQNGLLNTNEGAGIGFGKLRIYRIGNGIGIGVI